MFIVNGNSLRTVCELRLYPIKSNAFKTILDVQPIKQNLVVESVKGCTKVEKRFFVVVSGEEKIAIDAYNRAVPVD